MRAPFGEGPEGSPRVDEAKREWKQECGIVADEMQQDASTPSPS